MIQSALIILNLFLLESILSIDNIAVLGVMVKRLPNKDQKKALTYGIIGGMILRGLCLFIASWLINLYYLKILGGLYLIWLTFKSTQGEENIKKSYSTLWRTVIAIEFLDLIFSIDNIFAAVAITSHYHLIIIGVCLGIIMMRFGAILFTLFLNKYPYLETSAYWVIFLLGIKLIVEGIGKWINPHFHISETTNFVFSGITIIIFLLPIIFSKKKYNGR